MFLAQVSFHTIGGTINTVDINIAENDWNTFSISAGLEEYRNHNLRYHHFNHEQKDPVLPQGQPLESISKEIIQDCLDKANQFRERAKADDLLHTTLGAACAHMTQVEKLCVAIDFLTRHLAMKCPNPYANGRRHKLHAFTSVLRELEQKYLVQNDVQDYILSQHAAVAFAAYLLQEVHIFDHDAAVDRILSSLVRASQ